MADGSARIELEWADGKYEFRLGLKELRILQEKCNAGPLAVYRRLVDGTWRVDDVFETMRLGLMGAGMEPTKALKLVEQYAVERPLIENIPRAQAIIGVALVGPEDDQLPKPTATEETKSPDSRTVNSPSPPSTARVLQ